MDGYLRCIDRILMAKHTVLGGLTYGMPRPCGQALEPFLRQAIAVMFRDGWKP